MYFRASLSCRSRATLRPARSERDVVTSTLARAYVPKASPFARPANAVQQSTRSVRFRAGLSHIH
eukprot:6211762-Pleurochrysis_carterae.AAC.2